MKHFRRLLPALCLLLISAMCAGTSTYAWFSLNNTVTAEGLVITAESHGTLIIGESPLTTTSAGTSVNLATTTEYKLRPCTAVADADSGFKLMTLKPSLDRYIDAGKGIFNGKDGHVGTPSDANNDFETATANTCYVERVVYIGTQGQGASDAFNNVTLTMSIDQTESVQGAVSLLLKVNNGQWENYCLGSGDQVKAGLTAPIITASESGTKITFRIYYDGGLADPAAPGTTIVHTNGATLKDVKLTLDFDGTPATT